MYLYCILLFSWALSLNSINVLHVSFHQGCIHEIEYIAQQLSINLTSWHIPSLPQNFFDGKSSGNKLYNITKERADTIWHIHKEYFDQFDVILTSDTVPLSRIFLQNHCKKPIIIWVCNRFDYHDAASLDGDFPDPDYYQLISAAINQNTVTFINYTDFEYVYAQQKKVLLPHTIIKPSGGGYNATSMINSSIPANIIKKETFFIPPYHNDLETFNVSQICKNLGINAYAGRYAGPLDLQDMKGIIHIPYAWSTFAFFENMQQGIPYFIPSQNFLLELSNNPNFFFNHLTSQTISLAEWYNEEYKDIITYFDSWDDLKQKILITDFDALRIRILQKAHSHQEAVINAWHNTFMSLTRGNDETIN